MILIVKDWAFVQMTSGTGDYQRSVYMTGQTSNRVFPSPINRLLLQNLEDLKESYHLRLLKRDLFSYHSPATHRAPHSETPRVWRPEGYSHGNANWLPWDSDQDNMIISTRKDMIDPEEQPVLISLITHTLLAAERTDFTLSKESLLTLSENPPWNHSCGDLLEVLHGSKRGAFEMRLRLRALHISDQHEWFNQDIHFSETEISIRILATTPPNLARTYRYHTGDNIHKTHPFQNRQPNNAPGTYTEKYLQKI